MKKTFYLYEELDDHLRHSAEQRRVSESHLVREALESYLSTVSEEHVDA